MNSLTPTYVAAIMIPLASEHKTPISSNDFGLSDTKSSMKYFIMSRTLALFYE